MKIIKDAVILLLLTMFCICVTILHSKYINAVCVLDTIMWLLMVVTILHCILRHKVKWFVIQVGRKIIIYNLKIKEWQQHER